MEDLRIRAFRIHEFETNASVLSQFADPRGYLAHVTPAWVELLRTNPFAQPSDLALVLALDGERVVGRLGFYAAQVSLAGQLHRTYWMQGFFLDEAYRTSGAGGMLILPAISSLKCLIGAGGSAPETLRLYQTLKFVTPGPLKRYLHFYRVAPITMKLARQPALAKGAALAATPLLKLYNRYHVRRLGGVPRLTYRPVERFDQRIDELLAAEPRHFFPRGSALLNWLLTHRPLTAFEIYEQDRLLGYCLLNRTERGAIAQYNIPPTTSGSLLDYYLPAEAVEAKRDLLLFSVDYFSDKEVDYLECQVFDQGMPEHCRRLGMLQVGGFSVNFKPPRGQQVAATDPWFLTFGTGDVLLG